MKKIGKFFLWLGVLLLLLYGILYALIAFNQERIVQELNTTLKKEVNGDIHIGKINFTLFHHFPNATLKIKDVYLRGPRFAIYHKDFMRIEELFVSLKLWDLVSGKINLNKISLSNAEVFIFKTKDGYSNLDVFKKHPPSKDTTSKEKSGGFLLSLGQLSIQNTRIVFNDSAQGKSIGLTLVKTLNQVQSIDSGFQILVGGQIDFLGLLFRKEKGTFLKNTSTQVNLNLRFHPSTKQLWVDSSEIFLRTGKANLSGLFKFGKPMWFHLDIATNSIQAQEGISVLPDVVRDKLAKFGAEGLASARVKVEGFAIPNHPPNLDVHFETKEAKANLFGKVKLEELRVRGYYMNHIVDSILNDKSNSELIIEHLDAHYEGLPLQLKGRVRNFSDPYLDVHLSVQGNLKGLNSQLDSSKVKLNKGEIFTQINYVGKLKENKSKDGKKLPGKLNGVIKIKEGEALMVEKDLRISKLNTQISFNRQELNLTNLSLAINQDFIKMKGQMLGFISFFSGAGDPGFVKLDVETESLNLGNFMDKQKKKKSKIQKLKQRKNLYETLLKIEEKLSLEVNIKAKQLINGNFKATQASARLTLKNDELQFSKVQMKFAGGDYKVNGIIRELSKDWSPITLKASFEHVDMSEFMRAFHSFGMKKLTEENISGKLSTYVTIQSMMDTKLNIFNQYLHGDAQIILKDGKLNNFEPLIGIGDLVFANRDFQHIEFAEINGRIHTVGTESDISRMELSSNIIRLFVEGRHSLKDSTQIFIQIPLNNFKKRPKNLKPENVGTDSKMGPSVYLKISSDEDGKMKIGYAPFPKKKSEKKKS